MQMSKAETNRSPSSLLSYASTSNQMQSLPFKILLLEFKTGVWSNRVGLTQLEEYNLTPYIYSYIILFNLTFSVCFCHAGHM